MKKIIAILLALTFTIPFLTACQEEPQVGWTEEGVFAEVKDPNEIVEEGEDMNLSGKLYTEDNKPKDSNPIVIYSLAKDSFKLEAHGSYALPENINIQYLLDTIAAYSAQGKIKLTGKILGDVATVNINDKYELLAWLTVLYPNDYEKYAQIPTDADHSDVGFYADGFAMAIMELITKTIKVNLEIDTVIFKTNNDEAFLTLGEDCNVTDGIFFNEDLYPNYLGSIYNYVGDADFETLVNTYKEIIPELEGKTPEEQLKILNKRLY